jgi:hypothetical protein
MSALHPLATAERTPQYVSKVPQADMGRPRRFRTGRANFIIGELPTRTGLTTVGQAGGDVGLEEAAPVSSFRR